MTGEQPDDFGDLICQLLHSVPPEAVADFRTSSDGFRAPRPTPVGKSKFKQNPDDIDRALLDERKARATARSMPAQAELPSCDPMPTRVCGARTSAKNAGRGSPCKLTRISANGRCKFHGGFSTGPRTRGGRAKIAQAQRKRWAEWKAANPKLFHDISDRQERNIKRAFRQREALKRDVRSWIEKTLGSDCHSLMERNPQEPEAENAKAGERNKPLTPEQIAQADAFLEQWGSLTKQPLDKAREELQLLARRGYTVRDPRPSHSQQFVTNALALDSTTRPVLTGLEQVPAAVRIGRKLEERPAENTAQKLQKQIDRQPVSRVRRLEYAERQRLTQAYGEELVERYSLNKQRPTVHVGYASKKRR